MRKKILIMIVGMTLVLQLVPIVKATEFHIIKGTLYIDGSVAGAGIDIELEVIGNTFTIETFTQNETTGYNFFSSGFDDATYGDETVYFTVIYSGKSYSPIYNTSIDLNKDTEDVEVYILDLNIDTSEPANNPPYTPGNPSPGNGATGISISADLSWSGGDPDGDTVTYDVYFGTSSSPPLKKSDNTGTSYDVGTLSYKTEYYWQIVAEDEHGLTATGSIWSFTTKDSEDGGGGPPSPGGGIPPVANFTFQPANPKITEKIEFSNSSTDSDGNIVNLWWNFGDGYYSNLQNPVHIYYEVGTYNVTLTVTDDNGSIGTFAIFIVVTSPSEEIEYLIDDIEVMNLSQGLENSLMQKLMNALQSIGNGWIDDAINQLNAFINQVEAQRGNKLTDVQADYLVEEAQTIIDSL